MWHARNGLALMLGGRTPDGKGKQKEAFKLSLEIVDGHFQKERGMPSEKTHETSPGLWFVVGLRKGYLSRVDRLLEGQVMKLERLGGSVCGEPQGASEGSSVESSTAGFTI